MLTRTLNALAVSGSGVFVLIGRLTIGALFVPSGYIKLTHIAGFAQYLGGKGLPVPMAWAIVAALIEFFAPLAIVLGLGTRLATLLLVAFTVAAMLLGHPFWLGDDANHVQRINFFKDMAVAGGLLILFAHGPGVFALGQR